MRDSGSDPRGVTTAAGPADAPTPGSTRNEALVWSSAEDSRSAGYARSSLLTLVADSGESTSRTPSAVAVISRHPTRSVR